MAKLSDLADVDEFFRRGDEYSATSNSLEPPMGQEVTGSGASYELEPSSLRTPEQVARRRKFTRRVSVGMTVLGLCTAATLFAHSRSRGSQPVLALAAQDANGASPLMQDRSVELLPAVTGPTVVAAPVAAAVPVEKSASVEKSAPEVKSALVEKSAPEVKSVVDKPLQARQAAPSAKSSLAPNETKPQRDAVSNSSGVRIVSNRATNATANGTTKSLGVAATGAKPADSQPSTGSFD